MAAEALCGGTTEPVAEFIYTSPWKRPMLLISSSLPISNTVIYSCNRTWQNNQTQKHMLVLSIKCHRVVAFKTQSLWRRPKRTLRCVHTQRHVNTDTGLSQKWKNTSTGRIFDWALASQQWLQQLQVKPPPPQGLSVHCGWGQRVESASYVMWAFSLQTKGKHVSRCRHTGDDWCSISLWQALGDLKKITMSTKLW